MSRQRGDSAMIKLLLTFLGCVLSASLNAADRADFARLFSHASERSHLDQLRQKQQLKTESVQVAPTLIPVESHGPVSLQGYVKRGDGKKNTLWINNQPVAEDSTLGNMHIGRLSKRGPTLDSNQNLAHEAVDVTIKANNQTIRLQAGQRYAPKTNQIEALSGKEKSKSLDLAETDAIISDDKKSPP